MDLFRGLGKAGTGILGGVVHGAGKLVETAGNVAGSAPIVGGVVGGVVGGTGRAIEKVGDATENIGDALFGKKKADQKKSYEAPVDETLVDKAPADEAPDDEEEDDYMPFFDDYDVFVSLDGDDNRAYYDDTLEDLMAYDEKQARLKEEAADGEGEKMDEE